MGLVHAALLFASAALIASSQTFAWYGDEGFHLLAASLVGAGKVLYRDFFYQHPPLFPYLYAGWMQIAGETWRSAHLLSALLTATMFWLTADYVRARHVTEGATLALLVVLMLAANSQLLNQGTVAHPYALAMLLCVMAFRLIVHAAHRDASRSAFIAGIAAGGAACASLLSAPLILVIALWLLLLRRRQPARIAALAGNFLGGAALWLLPLAWFFFQAPEAAFFDLVEYHLFYRGSSWRAPTPAAYVDGLEKLGVWLRSAECLPRTLLALVAVGFLLRRDAVEDARRSELALAAAIAAAMALLASAAQPTYPYYFVLTVPFLAILACHGAWRIAGAKWITANQTFIYALLAMVIAAAFLKAVVRDRQLSDRPWRGLEQTAALLDSVVPRDEPFYAPDEALYFVARRFPLPGLENGFGSELGLPPGRMDALKIAPSARIDDWLRSGRFGAVWLRVDDPRIDALSLASLYAQRAATVTDAPGFLFWERILQQPSAAASAVQESPSNARDDVPASR